MTLLRSSSALLLLKEILGLVDTLNQSLVRLQIGVNLGNGQIDEHTSDLGGHFGAAHRLHKRENARANMLLIVGVLSNDSGHNRHSFGQISSRLCILGGHSIVHGYWGHHLRLRCLVHSDGHLLCLGHIVNHLLNGHALVHLVTFVGHLVAATLVVRAISLLITTIVLALLSTMTHVCLSLMLTGVTTSSVVLVTISGLTLVALVVLVVAALRGTLVHTLEVALLEKETQQVHDLVRVLHFVKTARVFSLVALEVLLVLLHLILHITILLNLVMVDIERVVLDNMGRQLSLGVASLVRSLKAHKSEGLFLVFLGEKLKRFDITEFAEKGLQVRLGHRCGEALNVQVAAFLRVFVLESFVLEFAFTLTLLESRADVKSSITDLFVVHLLNSTLSAARSILMVSCVLSSIANEGIGAVLVISHVN